MFKQIVGTISRRLFTQPMFAKPINSTASKYGSRLLGKLYTATDNQVCEFALDELCMHSYLVQSPMLLPGYFELNLQPMRTAPTHRLAWSLVGVLNNV